MSTESIPVGRASVASEESRAPDDKVVFGVALPLPEPYASQLQQARRRFGDPQADLIRTHITLSGPQELARHELDAVEAHLAAVASRHAPYRVLLEGAESFRPQTQVVFLRVAQGSGACAALAADVQSGPWAVQPAFPYHPHVTVAHDVPAVQLDAAQVEFADYRLEFEVAALSLYVRDAGGYWCPMRSFELGGVGST